MKYEDKFTPEAALSVLNSCVSFCDAVIAGKEVAVGLKYDEENMFAPMIVLLEKDAAAEAMISAAGASGVPVVKNVLLAKNLSSYGKAGEAIPEASYRDVSMALARLDSTKFNRRPRGPGKSRNGVPIKIPRPLSLELGDSIFALTGEEPGREKLLAEPLNIIRKRLVRLLGISLPFFRVSRNSRLRNDEYRILFKGLEAGRGRLELGWYPKSALAHPENELTHPESELLHPAAAPAFSVSTPNAVIPELINRPENIRTVAKAAASVLVRHAGEVIQARAPELLGRDEVEAILDAAEEKYPVVTGEVKNLLSLGIVREILQSLVSEQVSIRHIAVILETLADWGSFGPAPSDLIIERIRQSLKRQICLEYTDERLTLRVLTLEPKLEKKFSDHFPISGSEVDNFNSIREDWSDHISSAVKRMEEKGFPPVILCSPRARSRVKEATRRKFPDLAVLSYIEIPSDIRVEPVGEIRLEESIRLPGLLNEQ